MLSLADARYDFWGRYTPETPTRESGHHPLVAHEANKRLSFRWHLSEEDRTIQIDVQPRNDQQDNVRKKQQDDSQNNNQVAASSNSGGSRSAGAGLRPLLIDGAGITWPGSTG